MANDYLPDADAKLVDWLENFASVASTHVQELKLTQAQLTVITDNHTNAATAVSTAKSAKNVAKSKVEAKQTTLKSISESTRSIVNEIQGIPNLSSDLKVLLGIKPRNTPREKTPPTIPQGVDVAPDADGFNTVTWQRGSNIYPTSFIVEALLPNKQDYISVGVVTATKFVHADQTPGTRIYYRVRAARHGMTSQASKSVVVYGPQEGDAVQMAA